MDIRFKKGMIIALAAGVVSGFSVFLNKFAADNWHNSSVYTTEKNIVAALLLTAVVFALVKFEYLRKLKLKDWSKLILIGLVGGSIPFILFFKGLSLTDSASAAFWNKTLFIWVAILALPLLKEKLGKIQIIALALIIFANLSLFSPFKLVFGQSGILILLATLIWAAEYILAKKFMTDIKAEVLAWGRMFFGAIFLLIYLTFNHQISSLAHISATQLPWLLIVGVMLFTYTTFWYGALKKLPATMVAAIITIASPITTLLNNLYYGKVLPDNFWIYIVIISVGIILITAQKHIVKIKPSEAN